MPGPLPAVDRRRRNAPTIPTTALPAEGRSGPIPKPPKWTPLGPNGSAFWRWVWRTPQAAGWAAGHEAFVARRAQLEDLLEGAESRIPLYREMREIDDRLGLTPKGMAALRWTVVATPEAVSDAGATDEVSTRRQDRRARLSAS